MILCGYLYRLFGAYNVQDAHKFCLPMNLRKFCQVQVKECCEEDIFLQK